MTSIYIFKRHTACAAHPRSLHTLIALFDYPLSLLDYPLLIRIIYFINFQKPIQNESNVQRPVQEKYRGRR